MKNDQIILGGRYDPEFVISSGSLLLDRLLTAYNGIPSGSLVHYMSSKEGSFKTSFALMGLSNIQKLGHKVGFVDAEHALDPDWAAGIGVDIKNWFYSRPSSGEIALQHVVDMITKHDCKGVVVDSIDALQPSKLYEAEFGEANIGQHAKLITQGARKLNNIASEHNAIIFFINQMKVNLTAMGARGHQQTGGKGLPFYAKINLELERMQSNSQLQGVDLIPLRMKVQRSKIGPSFRNIETFAIQGKSIDTGGELVAVAQEFGLIKKAGSWWKTEQGDTIGQGNEAVAGWAYNNRELILAALNDGEIPDAV